MGFERGTWAHGQADGSPVLHPYHLESARKAVHFLNELPVVFNSGREKLKVFHTRYFPSRYFRNSHGANFDTSRGSAS